MTRPDFFKSDDYESFERKIRAFHQDKTQKVFFLVGDVGTGKTAYITNALKDLDLNNYKFVDMYGATTPKEAYLRLLGHKDSAHAVRLFWGFIGAIFLIYALINFILECYNKEALPINGMVSVAITMILGTFASYFASNSDDILYRLVSKLELTAKSEFLVIDDLDRSNLSHESAFGLIFNLKQNYHKKMIVTYGTSDASKVIDTVLKFEDSKYHIMESNAEVNLAIIKRLWDSQPIKEKNIDYLDYFSPREVKGLVLSLTNSNDAERSIIFMHKIFHSMLKKFKINLDSNQQDKFTFFDGQGNFGFFSDDLPISKDQLNIMKDIYSSMNFKITSHVTAPSNYMDLALKQKKLFPHELKMLVSAYSI